ncbi:transaldolase [bacterium J17]|nr:transaldolase [bacterium J17]
MAKNAAQELIKLGQSIWYDNISRELINSGELERLINEWGVRGITSNPTIFDNAISKSDVYDEAISALKSKGLTPDQVFETLAIEDIGKAADILIPIYNDSNGEDGFVSIEVSPLLASDTQGTINEALRLHKQLSRPNIMIKVPGTDEGIPAIYELLKQGVSVNVTLLFSVENYVEVAETYCKALEDRLKNGDPVDKIRSVASFFVSRVDSSVDKILGEIVAKGDGEQSSLAKDLLGKFGIANSKLAYQEFLKLFGGSSFSELSANGAAPQRPLWASTSTKNPDYRDVLYVEQLIGENTVNTVPHDTLEAFVDHGVAELTLNKEVEEAQSVKEQLLGLGVNLIKVLEDLQEEGVQKFANSFKDLNATIEKQLSIEA